MNKDIKTPPKFQFCPECEEIVRNNGWEICNECRERLHEYEQKYHCIIDIGLKGEPGPRGDCEAVGKKMRNKINQEILLEVIQKRSHSQPQVYTKDENDIVDTALKKQVKKSCNIICMDVFGADLSCPECGKIFRVDPMKEVDKYCADCGQRLYWRMEVR